MYARSLYVGGGKGETIWASMDRLYTFTEPWPVLPKGNQADNPINKLDPDLVVADLIGYFRATARVDIRLTLLLAFHFLPSPLCLKSHSIVSLSLSFLIQFLYSFKYRTHEITPKVIVIETFYKSRKKNSLFFDVMK